jgi:hypothetical protein
MLTLLVTVLATAYLVIPELLTRVVVGLRLVRKASNGTKSEEVVRASFWAVVPLVIAWYTRNVGFWKVPDDIAVSAQKVFSSLYSEKIFEADPAGFYAAVGDFTLFNLCLLARTYLIVVLIALIFAWIAMNLGAVRARLKGWPPFLTKLLHWAFVPRISEWDVALSPMLVHDRKELIVRIDVLTKGGILYRGIVFEKRINAEGDLATLILKDAQRMVRADFLRDRQVYEESKVADPTAKKPDTENYWRKIPGELFLLNGPEIATVNVRHVRPVGVLKPAEDERMLKAFAALRDQIARDLRELQENEEASAKLRDFQR